MKVGKNYNHTEHIHFKQSEKLSRFIALYTTD